MMKKTYAVFLAMAAMVPATACSKTSVDTKNAEAEIANTENTAGFHDYSSDDLALDCTLGFEQLKAAAAAMEGMEMATETDEQIAFMAPDGVSFTLTKEPHYAHPMIVRRDVVVSVAEQAASGETEVAVNMAACGYGTKEASDRLMEAFDNLNQRFILQQKITIVEE